MVTVRYESAFNSTFTNPFEVGVRHLKVAFCNGSQANLTNMAKERVIYRAFEANNNQFQPITLKQRLYHVLVGLGETLGYLTLVVPFVIATVDKHFNKPTSPVEHIAEGGTFPTTNGATFVAIDTADFRLNPFSLLAIEDEFYLNASWNTPALRGHYFQTYPHRFLKTYQTTSLPITPGIP